ncbi:unnamed protein product [Caenorhabditis auriculariae]|uniref:Sugar phosphate transporter domain-containing protein n=1 Tax=Caenorhabditis auriculariae TaxID=2777116 RepID=A0A8S1HNA0_9PELO|nr:unnamed protein product [Caenorhabditis auriculariae]
MESRRARGASKSFFGTSSTSVTSPFTVRREGKQVRKKNERPPAPETVPCNVQVLARPANKKDDQAGNLTEEKPTIMKPFKPTILPSALTNIFNQGRQNGRAEKPPPELLSPILNDSASFTQPPTMSDGIKLISDFSDISEALSEYLSSSVNYVVIAAIGVQGVGKSTLLSMLGGNNSQDMYREYIFRPVSRDANEFSRHQTILIDCQAINSYTVLEEMTRNSNPNDFRANAEMLKLLSFIFHISHTVLVCSDWYMDMNLIKTIRMAELFRPHLPKYSPALNLDRKTNLVFIHTKARSVDFTPSIKVERIRLLRAMFRDSKWLRLPDKDEMMLIPLPEIKPRKENHYNDLNHYETLLEAELVEDFDQIIRRFRIELIKLTRDNFAKDPTALDEKKWFHYCRAVWNDANIASDLEKNKAYDEKSGPGTVCESFTRLIVARAAVLRGRYSYPMTLALSNLMAVPLCAGVLMSFWHIKKVTLSPAQNRRYLYPIAIGKALAVGSAYFSLWKVPVSYAHTVKASMPLFAVFLSRFLLRERQSYRVYVSLLPIVAGVVVASATELSFSASGLISALFSTFVYSFLNILVKKLLKESDMHPIQLLALNSQLAALFFFPFWFCRDALTIMGNLASGELSESPESMPPDLWMIFVLICSGFLSFLQNVCAYSLIHELTALSYAVCNATKRITVIGSSLITLHNPVTGANIFGMLLAVFGVFCYNRAKQMDKEQSHVLPITRSHATLSEATLISLDTGENADIMHRAANGRASNGSRLGALDHYSATYNQTRVDDISSRRNVRFA